MWYLKAGVIASISNQRSGIQRRPAGPEEAHQFLTGSSQSSSSCSSSFSFFSLMQARDYLWLPERTRAEARGQRNRALNPGPGANTLLIIIVPATRFPGKETNARLIYILFLTLKWVRTTSTDPHLDWKKIHWTVIELEMHLMKRNELDGEKKIASTWYNSYDLQSKILRFHSRSRKYIFTFH